MNYEFTKLSEVEALNEVPENATVLAEVDGKIKRIPGSGLGGGDAIKTAIVKFVYYDEEVEYVKSESSAMPSSVMMSDSSEYSCINMTFDEAYNIMASGEPLNVVLMDAKHGGPTVSHCYTLLAGVQVFGEPTIGFIDPMTSINFIWNASGISPMDDGGGVS